MTPAGATYPYGMDPHDSNIRIAPSYPPLSDLELATSLFALCVKIEAIRSILTARGVSTSSANSRNGVNFPHA